MDTRIITKFTIATEQGINTLLFLTKAIAIEKFSGLLHAQELQNYITENFSDQTLMVEVNSMSNQWLVVYADDEPAGYARITSKGGRPQILDHKRAIRIADFGLLKRYDNPEIKQSLFAKCLSVCKSYEAIWINEYLKNPFMDFFESEGFAGHDSAGKLDELPLPSVYLIKQH
jgi:hypothetical protein